MNASWWVLDSTSTQAITPSGAIVVHEIVPKADGGKEKVAAGEYWDHNEWIVYGINTTHAMPSILISQHLIWLLFVFNNI